MKKKTRNLLFFVQVASTAPRDSRRKNLLKNNQKNLNNKTENDSIFIILILGDFTATWFRDQIQLTLTHQKRKLNEFQFLEWRFPSPPTIEKNATETIIARECAKNCEKEQIQ